MYGVWWSCKIVVHDKCCHSIIRMRPQVVEFIYTHCPEKDLTCVHNMRYSTLHVL